MASPLSPDPISAAVEHAHLLNSSLNIFTSIETDPVPTSHTGVLAGVPIALKDLIDHAGRVTTCGSAFYRETATTTAPSINRLEDAGAVIVGRTGLHEWAFGFSSENPHWGPVRNPWDPTTSPGGSSGGSAAAVAAGIVPIAIGTDTGGSVRVPAALCGTFGLKVTYGRIPLDGVFPLVPSVDTVGPLADSVANLETAYRVMSGTDRVEHRARPLRLGIPRPWVEDAPMSDEVAEAFNRAVSNLRDMGHEVVEFDLPGIVPDHHIQWAIAREVVEVHAEFRQQGQPYGPDVAARLDAADQVTETQANEGRAWQERVRDTFSSAFESIDLMITPTVPVRRKVIGIDTIGEHQYRAVVSYFSAIVNHTLHPAIAMPLADTGEPPLSLQAIGPMDGEDLLLGFAHLLEDSGVVRFIRQGLTQRPRSTDKLGATRTQTAVRGRHETRK